MAVSEICSCRHSRRSRVFGAPLPAGGPKNQHRPNLLHSSAPRWPGSSRPGSAARILLGAMQARTAHVDVFYRAFTACEGDAKTLILDVRPHKQFAKGHVKLAYSIRLTANGAALVVRCDAAGRLPGCCFPSCRQRRAAARARRAAATRRALRRAPWLAGGSATLFPALAGHAGPGAPPSGSGPGTAAFDRARVVCRGSRGAGLFQEQLQPELVARRVVRCGSSRPLASPQK